MVVGDGLECPECPEVGRWFWDVRVIGICSSIAVAVLFVVVGCGGVQAVLLSVVGCVLGLYSAVFVVGVRCVKRSDCIDDPVACLVRVQVCCR